MAVVYNRRYVGMKRLLGCCLAIIMLNFLTGMPVALAKNGKDLKNEINQDIKNRQKTLGDLQKKQGDLNDNESRQSTTTEKVAVVDSQIENENDKIHSKQNDINNTEQKVQTLKNNVEILQKKMNQRKKYIANRIRTTYIHDGTHKYLELLVDSKDFGDLISRVYFISQLEKHDHDILDEQANDKKKLEKDQNELKNTLIQLNGDLQNLKQLQSSLNDKKASEQAYLQQLDEEKDQIQTVISSKEQLVAYYKKQEATHRAELKQWEKELLENADVPKEIRQFVEPAQQLESSTGIPAAITIAQIILESGGQLSALAIEGKNLFGVKGSGSAGTINVNTHEVVNGETVTINAGFKKYNTYYQSMVDHAKVLQLPRYQVYLSQAQSLEEYAFGIQSGGYSTDPTYANKLLTIIKDYSLAQYDGGSF